MRESGIFTIDNDPAQEWLESFARMPDMGVLREAMLSVIDRDEVDLEDGAEALAAAEVVAGLLGKPSKELPDGVRDWLGRQQITVTHDLKVMAVRAVERVLGDRSGLRERWEQTTEGFQVWKSGVEALLGRLL